MNYTVKELCDYLGAKVPVEFKDRSNEQVKGINARYTTLEEGDVFFDINNDCEDLSLINPKTCPFIITDRDLEPGTLKLPIVKVDDALNRYVSLCKNFVDQSPQTIRIAVTGSTGKTSMKETIASILENTAATDKTFSNQNNIYFLSKRLQKTMEENLRFYVQEACIKIYNDINLTEKLAIAFQPNIVVMTNIFDNHAEVYGDRETTFRIKSSLVESMDENGIALLNMDDDILRNYRPKCKTLYYSLGNKDADIYAFNIKVSNEGTYFDLNWQDRVIKNIYCPLIGNPNIYNCMVAFAIGSINGVDDELLVRSIAKINLTYSLRQNHIKIGQYNLFIDCFNASLESIENDMKTMIDLSPDEGGRKIVVLGDIAELGDKAEDIHRNIGKNIARYSIDKFYYLGEYGNFVYEGAMASNTDIDIDVFENRDIFETEFKKYVKPGDLILFKASRSSHIELSIDNLFGTDYYPLYPKDYDIEARVYAYNGTKYPKDFTQRYYRVGDPIGGLLGKNHKGEFEYCNYENGIKVARYNSIAKNVTLPEMIDGKAIRTIGDRAFYKSKIVSINIPKSVVNIATNAFLRSYNLKSVEIPNSVKFLDYSSFAYCTVLEEINIPEGCLLIRSKAFYNCSRLKKIVINGKGTHIEKNAFKDAPNVEIYCKNGSCAEKYAIENEIKYRILEDDGLYSEVIIPMTQNKEIIIEDIWIKEYEKTCRLNFSIYVGNDKKDILWYEVDKKYKDYINDDRIDGIVVSLLLFAIRGKYTKIKSKHPVSEKLKYQLSNHLIPQIVDFEGKVNATEVIIDAPTTRKTYEKKMIANGTGFSRGVDSFATLYEYGKKSNASDNYKVNFLNVYNVGAFHGRDNGKRSYKLNRELYKEQMEDTVKFAKDNGYNSLVVDSNLALFIRAHFNGAEYGQLRKFENSATERNIGTTLLFQKLFDRFYYASGHTLKEFKLSLDGSSALWEQYAVSFFSTENIDFYISNKDWTRMEKIQHIVELPEAWDNLQVCLTHSKNCGKCKKCKRTLMNLDVLGEEFLDRFEKSFDLKTYKNEDREEFFKDLWIEKDDDEYAKDILKAAIDNNSKLLNYVKTYNFDKRYVYKYKKSRFPILSQPTYLAKEIGLLINDPTDENLMIKGIYDQEWIKVKTSSGKEGYINSDNISISEYMPAIEMNLNAGSTLNLNAGKSYKIRPMFVPNNGNEQVEYTIEDTNIAYVNKMGWVYGIKEGVTVLTATSESGLVSKCIVNVFPGVINMSLNAGKSLDLYVGKKYGLLPIFEPKGKEEDVVYSIDNDNIALVNKKGYIYAIGIGTTNLTAKSSSGAIATLTINVKNPHRANKSLETDEKKTVKSISKRKIKRILKELLRGKKSS